MINCNFILDKIKSNQRQYSDKNVYNNIMQVLNKIINEKIDISSEKLLEELAAKVFKNIKLGDIIFLKTFIKNIKTKLIKKIIKLLFTK